MIITDYPHIRRKKSKIIKGCVWKDLFKKLLGHNFNHVLILNIRLKTEGRTDIISFFIFLRLFFLLQLIYNVLPISAIQQSGPVIPTYIHTHTHTYTHTSSFSHYLPLCSITNDQVEFPVLQSRISLLINSKCNSLHLLTPNSQSIH